MNSWNNVQGIRFSMRGDVSLIEVDNVYAQAKMTAHGATVLSFCPKDPAGQVGEDLLWVSESASYDGKAAIRGGIPVCWPWFSGYQAEFNALLEDDVEPPAHGLVRKKAWHIDRIETLENGATLVEFVTQSDEQTRPIWPYEFTLSLQVVIGETLSLTLTTTNRNPLPIIITEALHTYFNLSVTKDITLNGLQGSQEVDTLKANKTRIVDGGLSVSSPIDNVYLAVQSSLLTSVDGQPSLQIDSSNAASCVVWNPGSETVKGFKDIADDHWPQFLCIENGNVWSDRVIIEPEAKHRLQIAISKP